MGWQERIDSASTTGDWLSIYEDAYDGSSAERNALYHLADLYDEDGNLYWVYEEAIAGGYDSIANIALNKLIDCYEEYGKLLWAYEEAEDGSGAEKKALYKIAGLDDDDVDLFWVLKEAENLDMDNTVSFVLKKMSEKYDDADTLYKILDKAEEDSKAYSNALYKLAGICEDTDDLRRIYNMALNIDFESTCKFLLGKLAKGCESELDLNWVLEEAEAGGYAYKVALGKLVDMCDNDEQLKEYYDMAKEYGMEQTQSNILKKLVKTCYDESDLEWIFNEAEKGTYPYRASLGRLINQCEDETELQEYYDLAEEEGMDRSQDQILNKMARSCNDQTTLDWVAEKAKEGSLAYNIATAKLYKMKPD